jgi:hypothetical protein
MYVALPTLSIGLTEPTPIGMLKALTNGSADQGYTHLHAIDALTGRLSGARPQCVAVDHTEIPLTTRSGASR